MIASCTPQLQREPAVSGSVPVEYALLGGEVMEVIR
jgi:hypothetical protein